MTRDMAAVGVGIPAECDAMIAGFCVHDELVTMARAGMTSLVALQTATVNSARCLGREMTLEPEPQVEPADVVLLDANPLEDFASIRPIRAVVEYLPRRARPPLARPGFVKNTPTVHDGLSRQREVS